MKHIKIIPCNLTLYLLIGIMISLTISCENTAFENVITKDEAEPTPVPPIIIDHRGEEIDIDAESLEDALEKVRESDVDLRNFVIDLSTFPDTLFELPAAVEGAGDTLSSVTYLEYPGINSRAVTLKNSGAVKTITLLKTGGTSYQDKDQGAVFYVGTNVLLSLQGNIILDGLNDTDDGIDNNSALVVLGDYACLELTGNARISGNKNAATAGNGGGVYTGIGSYIELSGTSSIKNNEAAGSGGGMWTDSTYMVIKDNASIKYNKAGVNGGGLCFNASSNFAMNDNAILQENEAVTNGGAMYTAQGNYILNDNAKITGNTARIGGGVSGGTSTNSIPACLVLNDSSEISHNMALCSDISVIANAEAMGGGVAWGYIFLMNDNSTIAYNTVINTVTITGSNKAVAGGGLSPRSRTGTFKLTMSGDSSIHDNTVDAQIDWNPTAQYVGGGGIYGCWSSVTGNTTITMNDTSSVYGNSVINHNGHAAGGGVYLYSGNSTTTTSLITMQGSSSVHNNTVIDGQEAPVTITATGYKFFKEALGGGLYIRGTAGLTMLGQSSVYENIAGSPDAVYKGAGSAVCLDAAEQVNYGATLTISEDATIPSLADDNNDNEDSSNSVCLIPREITAATPRVPHFIIGAKGMKEQSIIVDIKNAYLDTTAWPDNLNSKWDNGQFFYKDRKYPGKISDLMDKCTIRYFIYRGETANLTYNYDSNAGFEQTDPAYSCHFADDGTIQPNDSNN